MSPDLEAAGRDVVDAPVTAPSAVAVLEGRVRRRRARRATAMGAMALAVVVGVAAVAVAATRTDDKGGPVVVAPPDDLECTRATHDFGDKIARSVWTVTVDGVTTGAARVWEADGTANIATWTSENVDASPEVAKVAAACVTNPPVLALEDYPARGLFVQVPGDPTQLVVDADGTVLGSRGDDADIIEDARSTPPGTIPEESEGTNYWETRTWPSPDNEWQLRQSHDTCDRTHVHLMPSGSASVGLGVPGPGTDEFTSALGWLAPHRAAVLGRKQNCAADRSSLVGVVVLTIDGEQFTLFPAVEGKLEARVFERIAKSPSTTAATASTTTVAVTPQTTATTIATPKITVPNVLGLDAEGAAAALVAAGLNASVLSTANNDVAADTVFEQSPAAGTEVDPASIVVVHVAIRPVDMALDEARARWAARRVAQYSFEFQQLCFCTPESTAKVRVTVTNGKVVAVAAVDPDAAIMDRSAYRTVEELFDLIAEQQADATQRVSVNYGPNTGVPVSIDVSCVDERIADCGVQYKISNLEITG